MKEYTNLGRHAKVGSITGFVAAILVGLLPWMEKQPGVPLTTAQILTTLAGALVFALVTVVWELWQRMRARDPLTYIEKKWKDTIADIIVGNACFLLPWIVLTMGRYAGNVLRP
jgi:hypothetical protein